MNIERQETNQKVSVGDKIRHWLNDTENRSVVVPYAIFAFFALICYLFFCYHDILMTAQHSYGYLEGRITDYYTASYEMDGNYGSNYLPITFILFAIWNLPLKLFGAGPEFFGDWGVLFTLWNKLLPVLVLFASACVMYRLAMDRLQFGRGKAMIASMMLLMSPYAFFSQFLFSQYDSFVIFFMLLGLYFFFKEERTTKDWVLFALMFGVATSFKYFAAVIFAVLLVLKEKNIPKILWRVGVFAIPLVLQFGFYLLFDTHAFVESVFNFAALDYADVFGITTGIGTNNLIYFSLILIVAFAYFTKPTDEYSLLGWFCFYSCGVSFVLFGLMTWHPQWLMFAVPFWTLSTMINRRWDLFLLIDCLGAIVFNVLVALVFHHQADETLFRYGILSGELQFSQFSDYSIANLLGFEGVDLLYTLLVAIFAVSFIFKHPRFNMNRADEPMPHATKWLTARFLCCVLSFLIPAFLCLPAFYKQDTYLWANFSDGSETEQALTVTKKGEDLRQYLSLEGEEIHAIYIHTVYEDSWVEETDALTLTVRDAQRRVVGTAIVSGEAVVEDDMTEFRFEQPISIQEDVVYCVELSSNVKETFGIVAGIEEQPTHRYYNVLTQDYSDSKMVYCGETVENSIGLVMDIYGDH